MKILRQIKFKVFFITINNETVKEFNNNLNYNILYKNSEKPEAENVCV